MIVIDRLDHLVLTVRDIDRTCEFYSRVLGMAVITFGKGRKALQFGNQKINLHQTDDEFDPKAKYPTHGSADICFLTQTPLDEVIAHLARQKTGILAGPVQRTGATGAIESVYVRDPDDNLIEVSNTIRTVR